MSRGEVFYQWPEGGGTCRVYRGDRWLFTTRRSGIDPRLWVVVPRAAALATYAVVDDFGTLVPVRGLE